MAQTGFTPISLYYTTTAAAVPTAGNLVAGELAINTQDGKLFYKDAAGVVQVIAGKGGAGVAGGSNTQVQYNSSGSLAGDADMTFNGTTLTLANDASISGLTVGKGGGAVTSNTAVGLGALGSNTTGLQNTVFGNQSGSPATGSYQTAIGFQAGYKTTDSSYGNSFIGRYSGYNNTTGGNNTGCGGSSLTTNTTGSSNTACGVESLYANTTASNNTAVGYQAGYTVTTSPDNTFVGYRAGYVATGGYNTIVGKHAGLSLSTGEVNTFVGLGSGNAITTGGKNTILGGYSGNNGGLDIRTASNYIVLSDGDGNPRQIIDGSGNVGFNGSPTAGAKVTITTPNSNTGLYIPNGADNGYYAINIANPSTNHYAMRFGENGNSVGTILTSASATSYNTFSDYRLKENVAPMTGALDKVAQLKPVTYTWKRDNSEGQGFIAHELQEVVPECVTGTKDAIDRDGNPEYQGVDTSFLVATLTAAIQEQQVMIEQLTTRLNALEGK